MGNNATPQLDVFESIVMLRSINNRQAALDKSIRREWAKAIERIDPDIAHPTDIIIARYASLTGRPMVYDDHEYCSAQRIIYESWPMWKRIAIRLFLKLISRWECELFENHVTITVSKKIAKEHRRVSSHVFYFRTTVSWRKSKTYL